MTPQHLRRLTAFHLLMQTGSVTQAAEALAISQPAVSKLLQALEAETRLRLFDRSRRRLSPTRDAVRLHVEVERMFHAAGTIDYVANEIRSAGAGELRVATLPLLGLRVLPSILTAFARKRPGMRSSLMVCTSPDVVRSVAAGETELGFAMALSRGSGVTRQTLAEIPSVVVLPPRHRLAARRALHPRDLDGEAFISLARHDGSREAIDALFESHGVSRRIEHETNLNTAACALVAESAGISVVDALTPRLFDRRLVVRPMHPTVTARLDVLTAPGAPTSELTDQFVGAVRAGVMDLIAAVPSRRAG